MAVVAVGDFTPADIERLIKTVFGPIPARGGRAATAAVPRAGSRRHAVRGRDGPRSDGDDGRPLHDAPAARPDHRRRVPAAAGRAAVHAHDERAVVRADAARRPAVCEGRDRPRHLRPDQGSGDADGPGHRAGDRARARGAGDRVGPGRALRFHGARARAREARHAARLRERLRGEGQGGVGRPRRRVHPQLHPEGAAARHHVRVRPRAAVHPRDHPRGSEQGREGMDQRQPGGARQRAPEGRPDGAVRDASSRPRSRPRPNGTSGRTSR